MRCAGGQEFIGWLKAVRGAAKERGICSWRDMPVAAMAPPAMAAPDSVQASEPALVVTASSTPSDSANPEIAHNQKAGLDEGAIVKQIGDFPVALRDGRLFMTDILPRGEPGLKLAGRTDVCRSSTEDTWYDERLVSGRNIAVTRYSYAEIAREFTLLMRGDEGSAARQARSASRPTMTIQARTLPRG